LTPYPGRLGKGLTIEKDNYNFYQPQMRINIERTFGMLVKRFGILGRAQTSPLDHVSLAESGVLKPPDVAITSLSPRLLRSSWTFNDKLAHEQFLENFFFINMAINP
jgi:hypothetical protein